MRFYLPSLVVISLLATLAQAADTTPAAGAPPSAAPIADAPATGRPAAAPLPPDAIAPFHPSAGLAQTPNLFSVPTARVDVLIVSAPEEKVLPLLPRLRDPAQIEAAQAELLAMVARKEAVLEGWPDVLTHSGVRAVSEAIVEHRYPIEFDPVSSSAHQTLQSSGSAPAAANTKPTQAAGDSPQNIEGVVPTTFETRNIGVTLEVEPVVSPDQKAVTISLVPQVVRFERNLEYPAGTTSRGEKLTVGQPLFTTSKVSTTVSLRDGERRLLHVGKANEDKPRVELFIVGAKISAAAIAK